MAKVSKIPSVVKTPDYSTVPKEFTNIRRAKASDITLRDLEFFCDAMLHWAQTKDDAYDPIDFVMSWGIPTRTYYDWRAKYQIVADADADSCEAIGKRIYPKWLKGEYVSGLDKWLPIFRARLAQDKKDAKIFDNELAKDKITHQAREASKLAQETGFYLPKIREDNE